METKEDFEKKDKIIVLIGQVLRVLARFAHRGGQERCVHTLMSSLNPAICSFLVILVLGFNPADIDAEAEAGKGQALGDLCQLAEGETGKTA